MEKLFQLIRQTKLLYNKIRSVAIFKLRASLELFGALNPGGSALDNMLWLHAYPCKCLAEFQQSLVNLSVVNGFNPFLVSP
jgi:hypothetical protein